MRIMKEKTRKIIKNIPFLDLNKIFKKINNSNNETCGSKSFVLKFCEFNQQ